MTHLAHDIRAATLDDIDGLVDMVERYWRFESLPGFDRGSVGRCLEQLIVNESLATVLLASEGQHPCGYLLSAYVFSLEHGGLTAEIDELYVEPAHRSKGLGSALLASAEATARARGCGNLSLQLGRHNERARQFYRVHDFRERSAFELLEKSL